MERLTGRNEKGDLLLMGKQVYAGDFYEGISALEEYEDAEEQGRLVVLPCKMGTKLYRVIYSSAIQQHFIEWFEFDYSYIPIVLKAFGKTVFFTQLEAEEVLRNVQKEL